MPLSQRLLGYVSQSFSNASMDGGDKEACELIESMQKGSPFCQCLSWHLIDQAIADENKLDDLGRVAVALERDFAAMCRVLYRSDFCEGVRATLVKH